MKATTAQTLRDLLSNLGSLLKTSGPGLGQEALRRIAVAGTLRKLADEVERAQVASLELKWDGSDNVDVKKTLSDPIEFIRNLGVGGGDE